MFKTMVAIAAMTAVLALASCHKDDDHKTLKTSKAMIEVAVGKAETVTVSGGAEPYTAKSSDEKTATVAVNKNTVTVTGVKAGKATVTVTDKDKKTCSLGVTVK